MDIDCAKKLLDILTENSTRIPHKHPRFSVGDIAYRITEAYKDDWDDRALYKHY